VNTDTLKAGARRGFQGVVMGVRLLVVGWRGETLHSLTDATMMRMMMVIRLIYWSVHSLAEATMMRMMVIRLIYWSVHSPTDATMMRMMVIRLIY